MARFYGCNKIILLTPFCAGSHNHCKLHLAHFCQIVHLIHFQIRVLILRACWIVGNRFGVGCLHAVVPNGVHDPWICCVSHLTANIWLDPDHLHEYLLAYFNFYLHENSHPSLSNPCNPYFHRTYFLLSFRPSCCLWKQDLHRHLLGPSHFCFPVILSESLYISFFSCHYLTFVFNLTSSH